LPIVLCDLVAVHRESYHFIHGNERRARVPLPT
jgi:hypothetical protein